MSDSSITVYHVESGPEEVVHYDGSIDYTVRAIVTVDDGETCGPMHFYFETEEFAIKFKQEVNSKMEPTIVGNDDNE